MAVGILSVDLQLSDGWHQTHVTIVAHPDRRLMSAEKPLDHRVAVVVWANAYLVFASHCRPMGHPKRPRDAWYHATVIKDTRPSGANHWINIIDWLLSQG